VSRVELRNVWKEYGDHVVLERLKLRVEAGEFCTVVGASGCGKTTFLRMLLGEEGPTRGQISLDGDPLPAEPGPDRGIVFQRYSYFRTSPCSRTSCWARAARGYPDRPLVRRGAPPGAGAGREMLVAVGLEQALDKYPAQLSGGMQQRLALAQSLVTQPRILLLDEPFGALDPGIRADMHKLVLDLWARHGLTVFMITHDLKEGFYLGTRLLVFDRVRHDPHAPHAYGATITYDLPVGATDRGLYEAIREDVQKSEAAPAEAA